MSLNFDGKVALVTGSSSGLGEAIALLFAARGAHVTLCGRDAERLLKVVDSATEISGGHRERFISVTGDINEAAARKKIVEETIKAFGQLDILVANAGVSIPNGTITDATPEIYDQLMNTNVKAVFFLIQEALPFLEKSRGNIVCMSSMLSSLVAVPSCIYPMSKAAVDHLARCLAVELGPKGIRVNTVNPSFIPTRIRRSYDNNDAWFENEKAILPLQGLDATAQHVAEAVLFLASDASGFTTGQHLKIDGGRSYAGPFGSPPKPKDN
ncbi:3-oxoacyl-[acyl-carrier-protein] reductase FabG [Biomphalaria pfeifferi]|uniref:3-oxoacyl-[acyl-carrier-protein] reductase FabG n=1 Tax=Biomphalaria pfeifferi TaxID=112525 RepID=A0AAD8BS87_BIOPF|nr:3-oxoacyl-[acyl-carrier-protein] reductase FabG [Biomphalaria pfeifferi]